MQAGLEDARSWLCPEPRDRERLIDMDARRAGVEQTRDMAERLRAATDSEPCAGVPVTASFGVAASGREGLRFQSLFEQADAALYRAKEGGRNRVASTGDGLVPAIT